MRPLRSLFPTAVLLVLFAPACSGSSSGNGASSTPWNGDSAPSSIDDVFANALVQQAIGAYDAQRKATGQETCTFGHFAGWDSPASAVGTWTYTQCDTLNSSDGATSLGSSGIPCSGEITFSNQSGDQIQQANTGGVSAGEGEGFILGATVGELYWYEIAQWNQAMGEGCTQNVINLIEFSKNTSLTTDQWVMCLFTVVLDSTGCVADPWWKESEGYASFN